MSFSILSSKSNDHRNFRGPGEHPITKHMGAWGGGLARRSESKPQKYLFKNSNIRKMLKSYLPYILKYSLSAVDITRFASRLLCFSLSDTLCVRGCDQRYQRRFTHKSLSALYVLLMIPLNFALRTPPMHEIFQVRSSVHISQQ